MKSDREFIDGIYKKAKERQIHEQKELNNQSIYHRGYKTLKPVFITGMAIVLICSGIFAYDQEMFPFQVETNRINMERYSNTPDLANEDMIRGVEPIGFTGTSIPIEIQEEMKEGTVIRGKVTELLENESFGEMKVSIHKVYVGEEKIGSTINVMFNNNLLSEYSYNLLTGVDDILLYLKVNEDNQYSIAHDTYGVLSYSEQVHGFDVYLGEDSVILNTNIFNGNNE